MQGVAVLTDPQGQPSVLTIDLKHHSPEIDNLLDKFLEILEKAKREEETERRDWLKLSMTNLNRAYGDEEEEYTEADLIQLNPKFKSWKER